MQRKIKLLTLSMLLAAVGLIGTGCGDDDGESYVSSRAYKGHENDLDINYFVNAYPNTVGTRLDDCQTCHTGGTFTYDSGGQLRTVSFNACDFCHMVIHPHDPEYDQTQPTGFSETLNPYGQDYLDAGRDPAAFGAIADIDSDGDGYGNAEEIAVLRYPGDDQSMPGQEVAPMQTFSLADLEALDDHEQFGLANSNKQQFDFYASYRGVRVVDLLEAAGVDTGDTAIEGITVIAPDGYLKDFSIEDVLNPFPAGLFYAGLDTATLGTECGFVEYPDSIPAGVVDGAEIPGEQWLLLAYERDGLAIDPSNLDITSGKINGEGPYRVVVPQVTPGMPDRGLNYSPTTCGDGYDYDASFDHNAGAMVRGVIAIRVNPLPAGYEDFDYRNGGWAYIDDVEVLVYGYGVTTP
ncbi:MAG: GEGP motif-containing diheme protein [bacterium]